MDQNSKEKKLFFFGQPDCLKVKFDIPIRPTENSDSTSDVKEMIGEKNNSEGLTENTLIDDKSTTKKAENSSSDDDGEELLKKIDAVLEVKNEHQCKDNSENLSNETIEKTPINDASNNHVDEVSAETIQKESLNNIEKQSDETSTKEISQEKCEEKCALEKASSANTETITEKIENVYNVKSVDNNIEFNDENNLAVDECKPIELKSEEISSKSQESVDEKVEVTENFVKNPLESSQDVENICELKETKEIMENESPNESSLEEKSLEKEDISLKEVKNVESNSSGENLVVEKSHEESDEKIIECTVENKEKEIHSENKASELPDNQTKTCESSVNNEAIDPVICKGGQNDTKLESDEYIPSDQQPSSSLITEKDLKSTHTEPQDITDSTNITKLPEYKEDVSSESPQSEIKITESISEISEEQAVCESEETPLQEEIKGSEVSNNENTCPSHEPQVLPNETSIKLDEESVPKNDCLEHTVDSVETKEATFHDDDDKNMHIQLEVTDDVENVESHIKESEEASHVEVNKNENIEVRETPNETKKDDSLLENENNITQSKEEEDVVDTHADQTEEKLSTENELNENTQATVLENESTEENIAICKVENTDLCDETLVVSKTEDKCKEDQASTSEPTVQHEETLATDEIVSDQETKQQIQSDIVNLAEDSVKPEVKESEIIELSNEESKIVEPTNINESTDLESSPAPIEEKIEESQDTDMQIYEKEDENLALSQKSPLQLENVKEEDLTIENSLIAEKKASSDDACTYSDQDQTGDIETINKELVYDEVIRSDVPQIQTEPEKINETEIGAIESSEKEQNKSVSMESEECNKKEEILDIIQEQATEVHSEDSSESAAVEISEMRSNIIQEPVAMEIDDNNTETESQIETNTEIMSQDENATIESQIIVQPIGESKSSNMEEVMNVKDQDAPLEVTTDSKIEDISDLQSEVNGKGENLQIEQTEPKLEISVGEEIEIKDDQVAPVVQPVQEYQSSDTVEIMETKDQVNEIQQNVDTLGSNKEEDACTEEVNATEISDGEKVANVDDLKGHEISSIVEENEAGFLNKNMVTEITENENIEAENLHSDQIENEKVVLEHQQTSEILKTDDATVIEEDSSIPSIAEEKSEIPVVIEEENSMLDEATSTAEEKFTEDNKSVPVDNESSSKEDIENISEDVEIGESQPIEEDPSSSQQEIEMASEKNEEIDENLKSELIQEHEDLKNENEIDSVEKIDENIQKEEKVELKSIQENLQNQTEPKEYEPQPPNEELNEIECSASVENLETPQEVNDKPEVLSELPKESFKHEDKTENPTVVTQSIESQNVDDSLSQNIDKVEIPPPCVESEDSHISEIDENESEKIVDLDEKLESKIETKCKDDSLSSSDPIVSESNESNFNDEIEVIPQKSITVEENSNEKINDNQVELSKNDNESSSLEKVSLLDDINIQNEISEDLIKTNTKLIEEEGNIEEGCSVSQTTKDIQPQLDEKVAENTDEEKVELKTEKQYEQITERHTEDNLTDKINDEKCKEDINVEIIKESVVENLTEKIILNEMPVKEVCTDNNQDNDDHSLESDSKCSELINPPSEKIAINLEIESKLEIKETAETLDDRLKLEDSGTEKILSMDTPKAFDDNVSSVDQKEAVETVLVKHIEITNEICATKNVEEKSLQPPVDPLEEISVEPPSANVFDDLLDKETKLESIPITKSFQKPISTRKRKMSERKSISESDSDGASHFVTDSVSNEKGSSDEETVATKKPRIRNKIAATRNTRATRQSARVLEEAKSSPEAKIKEQKKSDTEVKAKEQKKPDIEIKTKEQKKPDTEEKKVEEKTLQNLKFDYDENEDIASKMAAIKTLICKDIPKKTEDDDDDDDESNETSADESSKKKPVRKGRKSKRGRVGKKNDAQESSSDDSKSAKVPDSKRSKTSESEETPAEKQSRKKRDSTGKGLLKYIDTSLVIDTVETETPVRQSRRIAQQKIREETERRQMEEKMLKQMKAEAERKKQMALIPDEPDDENDHSSDESYKDSTRKKKKKLKPSDKPWQTSSSHSEHSETEDEFERPQSEDPGSPLFRSDHEFSPESDDDEAPAQPMKRARTAKKQVEESSDDEDVNPIHACQVCHKTDCPEWILLCDECDHGYHCSCLKPIIFCIPSGNWYCPLCCHKKLVDDLSGQLEKLDTLIVNVKAEEIRHQKQLEIKKLAEITQENILKEKRKKRSEIKAKEEQSRGTKSRGRSSNDGSESNDDESSENSSDNEPLNEMFYKLRRRNQNTTSYRFNDYDDLINSAIKRDMDEVKGMGNAGRGKDISTIIEADKEEKKLQQMEKDKDTDDKVEKPSDHQEGGESSGSDIIRPKKAMQRKKKNRKLNNLDATSEEDQASDEDFKGTPSTNSDTEEEYSISSNDVSESSLDLPSKKSKIGPRRTRSAAKNRRYDEKFIDDNSSDDEPLIKKRIKKQIDSDEEEFDVNEENSDGSTPEDIDSEDLCDDTESDDSSENNWPKKKKKRVASYDIKKPRKYPKKTDDGKDKAFRAGISKKKILKQSDNESEASDNDSDKGRRRTRGKKLLYLIEDDYESDDGIKPGIGVVRPETPPEERELFVKKQEEIKRMLAEKNTEAARQLAVPTIEPIQFALEQPESPLPPPLTSDELASLSTIPKNVIEGAKALDMDYNKIKPIHFGVHSKTSDHPSAHDMSEEDLARMMEEEDFAQHQLKMVGETINRNKLLELEVKEEAFANIGKGGKIKEEREPEKLAPPETKKRVRKPKQEKQVGEFPSPPAKILQTEAALQKGHATQHIAQQNVPVSVPTSLPLAHESSKPFTQNIPSVPPLISNPSAHSPYPNMPPRYPGPHPLNIQDRPSVLSNYMPRHEGMSRFEGMPPRLEGMRPRLEGMPPRLSMQPRLEGMLSRLEGMGPRIQGMPPRLEGMQPRLEGLSAMGPRLEGITARLEGMTARLEVGPQQHMRFSHPPSERFPHPSSERFPLKSPPIAPQQPPQQTNEGPHEGEEKKKGRRKKYTPLRTDLIDSNASKVAKLETPTTSSVIHSTLNLSTERPDDKSKVSLPPLQRGKPEVFNPATNPSSVITRLLQPQQRQSFGGFAEQMNVSVTSASNPNAPTNSRAFPEDMKHLPIAKQVRPGPPAQFSENPFVPRGMHTLYRGPTTTQPSIYGIPSHHARIPYPFHLHPNNNLRPNIQEYGAPYNIPPQFGYYAPPAHSRQHPSNPAAPPLSHQEHPDIPPNNARPNNNVNPNDEQSESSEFGGLVSYFSSQQELD